MVMNDDWLEALGDGVQCDNHSHKAVGRFNKHERREVQDLFTQITSLNMTSIASVCHTDAQTVDLLLQEFFATAADQVRQGQRIRLNFKTGFLNVANGLVYWQLSRELRMRHESTAFERDDESSVPSTV